jgi:hypothetical protein
MMAESRNSGTKEEAVVAMQWHEHISTAMNKHAATEEP